MDLKRHEIPTHLDVEDTLFLGLTVRQAFIVMVGCAIGYSGWQSLAHAHLPAIARVILCAVVPLLAVLVAAAKPAARPLELWILAFLRYHAQPRVYVWRPVAREAMTETDDEEGARAGEPVAPASKMR